MLTGGRFAVTTLHIGVGQPRMPMPGTSAPQAETINKELADVLK